MRIAIISPTFPPYGGGIGMVAAHHARELVRRGHQVRVFTPAYQATVNEVFIDLDIARVKPVLAFGNAAWLPGLYKQLQGFDIVHIHYPFFGAAEPLWLHYHRLRRWGSRVIIHYHMDVVGRDWRWGVFQLHTTWLLPRIIRGADAVIGTSLDYLATSQIARLRLPTERLYEVPNGVAIDTFRPGIATDELRQRHGIEPDEQVVLFVGGLDSAHYFKGIEYLLEAMARLQQAEQYRWRLVIVGEGNLRPKYQDLASQLAIGGKTVFTGRVSDAELPMYYNLANVVVLPSVDASEAFGLTLVEAMACGKPTVASRLAGVRSVVDDGMTGILTEPRNVDALASAIDYFLRTPDAAVAYGQAGLIKAQRQYAWTVIGDQLETIYQHVHSRALAVK